MFEDIGKLVRHKGFERPRSQEREESSRVSPASNITSSPLKAFPGGSDGKESTCNAGDPGTITGSRRFPGVMATPSSILAWRIPWTEKPGGLLFMGSQTVGHD